MCAFKGMEHRTKLEKKEKKTEFANLAIYG